MHKSLLYGKWLMSSPNKQKTSYATVYEPILMNQTSMYRKKFYLFFKTNT
jgi:hypothetical protein